MTETIPEPELNETNQARLEAFGRGDFFTNRKEISQMYMDLTKEYDGLTYQIRVDLGNSHADGFIDTNVIPLYRSHLRTIRDIGRQLEL